MQTVICQMTVTGTLCLMPVAVSHCIQLNVELHVVTSEYNTC